MSNADSRARSFDKKAAEYDRFRPDYPPEIIACLVELSRLGPSSKVLEVGCGTGKATVPVAKVGCQVHCVDPGPSLVAIARRACADYPNVRFSVATFEEAALPAGYYDLVYAAQAFHWTARETRWQRCHRLLVPGGSVALLYNFAVHPRTAAGKELIEIVRAGSNGAMSAHDHEESVAAWTEEMGSSGLFEQVTTRRHPWTAVCDAERYVGLLETHSDFAQLPPNTRRDIADDLRAAIAGHGGQALLAYETVLFHGRRREGDLPTL